MGLLTEMKFNKNVSWIHLCSIVACWEWKSKVLKTLLKIKYYSSSSLANANFRTRTVNLHCTHTSLTLGIRQWSFSRLSPGRGLTPPIWNRILPQKSVFQIMNDNSLFTANCRCKQPKNGFINSYICDSFGEIHDITILFCLIYDHIWLYLGSGL